MRNIGEDDYGDKGLAPTVGALPEPSAPTVTLTVITNSAGPATKTFSLDADGKLVKKSAAQIVEGEARTVEVAGLSGLLKLIKGLSGNQALTYGVADVQHARLVTQKALKNGAANGAVARDRDHFHFAEGCPGVLMLDYDPRPKQQPKDYDELDAILCEVMREWGQTERCWRASASSHIYTADGERELIGVGGWRAYAIVDNAAAIPEVGNGLYQRLWQTEHSYIQISKSGALLDRSIIDAAVWQPERLDFVADPKMGEGLMRLPPKGARGVILPGRPVLQAAGLVSDIPMDEWRRTSSELQAARREVEPEADKVRCRFVKERVEELKREGINVDASVIERAVKQRILASDFRLHAEDGRTVSVRELLADREAWDDVRFADPLEPDYAGDKRIAVARLSGRQPGIFSHAHGGIWYAIEVPAADSTEPIRFRLFSLSEIEILDDAYLIDGLVPARGLMIIYGAPGCGKSFLAIDVALHIATGRPYGGLEVEKRRVVYIAAEGQGGFGKRVKAAQKHLGLSDDEPFRLITVAPNLGKERGDAKKLIDDIKRQTADTPEPPIGVIYIDTVTRVLVGGKENTDEGMGAFVMNADEIAKTFNCLVIAIHHTGKIEANGMRGWSGLHGACDAEWEVTRTETSRSVLVVKMKDGEDGKKWTFCLEQVALEPEQKDARRNKAQCFTCIVKLTSTPKQVDAAQSVSVKRPKGQAAEFVKAVKRAIEDAGELMSGAGRTPTDVRGVKRETLKKYAEMHGFMDGASADSRRNAMNRHIRVLAGNGHLHQWGEWVWLP